VKSDVNEYRPAQSHAEDRRMLCEEFLSRHLFVELESSMHQQVVTLFTISSCTSPQSSKVSPLSSAITRRSSTEFRYPFTLIPTAVAAQKEQISRDWTAPFAVSTSDNDND
jgi:hypothetical protein